METTNQGVWCPSCEHRSIYNIPGFEGYVCYSCDRRFTKQEVEALKEKTETRCVVCGGEKKEWMVEIIIECVTEVGGKYAVKIEPENGSVCKECASKMRKAFVDSRIFWPENLSNY